MSCYECKDERLYLKIRVVTKATKNAFLGVVEDRLKISIKSLPEKGKANQLLIKWLSKELHVCQNEITLHLGLKNHDKELILPLKCLARIETFLLSKE